MKKILILYFSFLSCYANSQKVSKTLSVERMRLKNYGFCNCIIYSNTSKDSLMFTNEGSAAGYLELGNYTKEAYDLVDSLAKEYSKKNYPSKERRSLIFMKCLDFYNSKELERAILSSDKYLNK